MFWLSLSLAPSLGIRRGDCLNLMNDRLTVGGGPQPRGLRGWHGETVPNQAAALAVSVSIRSLPSPAKKKHHLMKATTRSLLVFCLALAGLALHAQSTAPTSSLSSLIAEARGLPLMQPGQVPIHGTYWVLEPWGINGVTPVPYPCPPFDPTMPIYALTPENQAENQIYLVDATVGTRPVLNPVLSRRLGPSYTLESVVEAQANLVVNLITQIQTAQAHLNQNGYPVFFGTNGFGTNGFGDGGLPVNSYVYTIDTNMLWLQITNISDGTVYANLYRATDYVYSVWSTTNLADPLPTWRVETEVFPTNPNCMTFTVSQAGRPDLFLRGQDWTGMSATGNVTELWWLYYYFGNAGLQLSDTNLDVWGSNTLVFDYTNGLAPTDYYGGFLPYLQTFSGDQQSGPLDAFLPQPLVVQVTDGFNNCLSNAPLTFSVTNGLNQLAATYGGPLATNLNVTTDGNGLARAWLFLPTNAPAVNYVTVTAHSGPYAEQLYFTAYEGEVAPPAISPAGGAFTVIQSVAVSCSTTGAVMHYTLDGTDPTEDDPAATNGQALLAPWTATLKVAAFADAILLPSAVSAADFTILHPLVAGRKHTLLLQPDETILAGGSNGSGQLGDGTTMDRTNLAGVLNLTNAVGIAAGALHSLAWAADGSAWAWGDNSSGQLGDGQSSGQQSSPTNLSGLSGVIQMSGGGQHSLALDGNHGVWAWGNNASGQLGDGATSPQTIPEQLNGLSNIVEVAAGGAHSLALAADETVRAWGNNASGQLGDGTSTQRTSPVMVGGLTNVLALAAGFNHSLALVSDETVRAWGDNTYGQLGDGTFTERNQPVKVLGVSNLVAIAAGEYHNLALKADGTVWSWGCNSHGQLGDGTTTTRIAPVPVSGLSNVLAIAAGWAHSAALKSDGTVVVWGSIPYGLNGDASANFSTVPVTEEPSVLVNWEPPTIAVQPFSQEVLAGDDVSFNVVATGTNLTYQWNLDGTPIPGANASVYALKNVQSGGNYTVTVGTGLNSVVSSNAVLTVDWGTGWPNLMEVLGQRLNYTFKNGVTYYIGSPVQLYGTTTIEGGAVLKFDYSLNSSLSVLGSLNCKTESYYPAFLTSVDDPCVGENIGYGYYPQPYLTGTPYLDLSQTTNASISNLRISYADLGVTTPAAGQLDIWDCQVLQCNSGVVNAFGGVDSLHNVLFAGCGDAVCAYTNNCTIMAEQMTADVSQFVSSSGASPRVSLTNSIILGGAGSVSPTNIQAVGAGNYYLAANSPLRQSGTTNLSRRLLGELKTRTTYPPVAMPSFMQLNGNLMLGLQAPRYTNGAPDLGYYYPAIDYTVSYLTNFGAITVLPGTVIGLSDQYIPNFGWTWWGFDLREGSSLVAHGMPNRPIVFVDAALVQEQFQLPVFGSLVPDYESPDSAPPVMDFRFCNFYASPECDHVWAGYDVWFSYVPSPDSLVNWTMRDCNLHGGWINLGCPDDGMFFGLSPLNFYGSGAVGWTNNSFDSVYFNLDPTWIWYPNYGDTINCDLAFSAANNLSRNAGIFYLEPIPSSAGNWTFYNNFFDKADFLQDTNYQALDYNYNGYWPLLPTELLWGGDASQLISSTASGPTTGSNEVVVAAAPPYQRSYFGHFYLPTNTPLYGAGSDTAANLGLYHYTTRVDQVKEGNDVTAGKPNASIGLHYIAATNGVPMDFDGDGIPDYVENWNGDGNYSAHLGVETDWQNRITDRVNPDPSNSLYLNIDLSGDGLTGRAKQLLEMNPLDTSNPLTLTPSAGSNSDTLIFNVPVNFNLLGTNGSLGVVANGIPSSFERCNQNTTNGSCQLTWNTIYQQAGLNLIQASITVNGQTNISGIGAVMVYNVNIDQPPYLFALIPGTANWSSASVQARLASVLIPQDWQNSAGSWQLFCSVVSSPYFRTIDVAGYPIGNCYIASKNGSMQTLQILENQPDFGANNLRYLSGLDLNAMLSSDCADKNPCMLDYDIVCYMASLNSSLTTLDQPSYQRLFQLAVWDSNYFISNGDNSLAAGAVNLMYAIYNQPESLRGVLPVTLSPLTGDQIASLSSLTLPDELIPVVQSAQAALALTSRP